MKRFTLTASALALSLAAPAFAQNINQDVDVIREGRIGLDEWNYDRLYEEGTWSAEQLFDAEVFGVQGEDIGGVQNLLVGTDGMVEAVIVEVGGFLDLGDTHVRVPWNEVTANFADGEMNIRVPVNEDNVDDYDVFGGTGGEFRVIDDDEEYYAPRAWRATELIDDFVTLDDGDRYGYVEDLLFNQSGRLEAVVVNSTYGGVAGRYAYPYYGYGYGFRPGYNYYGMPYDRDEVGAMEPFDYDRFEVID